MRNFTLSVLTFLAISVSSQAQEEWTYQNDFSSSKQSELTIHGGGSFVTTDATFKNVFQNVNTSQQRTNYLLINEAVLGHSTETKELTIVFSTNRRTETTSTNYSWAPLFMAYGTEPASTGNTWPMLALQYRLVAQVNCNGWSDFTDALNDAKANTLYQNSLDWLADGAWHYFTAVFTTTTCKIYVDGELKNSWTMDGTSDGQVISGLFSNGADLKYICLGGNQAWDWKDNDAAFKYARLYVSNKAKTADEIKTIIAADKTTTKINAVTALHQKKD